MLTSSSPAQHPCCIKAKEAWLDALSPSCVHVGGEDMLMIVVGVILVCIFKLPGAFGHGKIYKHLSFFTAQMGCDLSLVSAP